MKRTHLNTFIKEYLHTNLYDRTRRKVIPTATKIHLSLFSLLKHNLVCMNIETHF